MDRFVKKYICNFRGSGNSGSSGGGGFSRRMGGGRGFSRRMGGGRGFSSHMGGGGSSKGASGGSSGGSFGGSLFGRGNTKSSGCGCISLLIIVIIIGILYFLFSNGVSGTYATNNTPVVVNQVQRTKLENSLCKKSNEWILDDANYLSNRNTVIKSMQYFYDKTGVQPYLIIEKSPDSYQNINESEVEKVLNDVYDRLYDDEGHMILIFVDYYNYDRYYSAIRTGSAAKTVVDSNAEDIIYNNMDRYYSDSSMDDTKYFSTIFEKSADTMMQKVTTANDVRISENKAKSSKTWVLGIVAIVVIVGVVVKKVSDNKVKEKEAAKKILEQDIIKDDYNTFTSADLDKKYDKLNK